MPTSSGVATGHPSVGQGAGGTGAAVEVVVAEDVGGAVEDDDGEEVAASDDVGSAEDVAPPPESLQAPTISARQTAAGTHLDRNARRSAISTHGLRSHIIAPPASTEQRQLPAPGLVHPKAVQVHLGHSSIAVTKDRYAHLFPSDVEALIGRLEDSGLEVSRLRRVCF